MGKTESVSPPKGEQPFLSRGVAGSLVLLTEESGNSLILKR